MGERDNTKIFAQGGIVNDGGMHVYRNVVAWDQYGIEVYVKENPTVFTIIPFTI